MPEVVSTRPLLDKLGIRHRARVGLVGLEAPWFVDLLAERTADVWFDDPIPGSDLVFLGADSTGDLARLGPLRSTIGQSGGIWVVSRKGRAATLRDTDVIAAAIASGLVDNKVVAFSETQTALRLVIPRALRTG